MPSIILTHKSQYPNRHKDGGGQYRLEIQITFDVTYKIKFSHFVPDIRKYPIIPIDRYICDIVYIPQIMLDAIKLMHLSEEDKNGEKLYAGLVNIFSNLQQEYISNVKSQTITNIDKKYTNNIAKSQNDLTDILDKKQEINKISFH